MNKPSNFCEFCQILQRRDKSSTIIAQNIEFFAFHDLDDGSAQAHILVCTKKHIQSALHLADPRVAFQMQKFGQQVLTALYKQKYKRQPPPKSFRFGFHLPPYTSIDHIHLHCFILPFRLIMNDKVKYGFGAFLKSVEEVVQQLISEKPKL